jgi:hypothetical protein
MDELGREVVPNKGQNPRDKDCNLPTFTATLENDSYDLHSALCRYLFALYLLILYLYISRKMRIVCMIKIQFVKWRYLLPHSLLIVYLYIYVCLELNFTISLLEQCVG